MFGLSKTEKIKNHYPIDELIRSYGIVLKWNQQTLTGFCPFHNDQKNPNLKVTPSEKLWHCFACKIGGSVIDFVMRKETLSEKEAIDKLHEAIEASQPFATSQPLVKEAPKPTLSIPNVLDEVSRVYHASFLRHEGVQD